MILHPPFNSVLRLFFLFPFLTVKGGFFGFFRFAFLLFFPLYACRCTNFFLSFGDKPGLEKSWHTNRPTPRKTYKYTEGDLYSFFCWNGADLTHHAHARGMPTRIWDMAHGNRWYTDISTWTWESLLFSGFAFVIAFPVYSPLVARFFFDFSIFRFFLFFLQVFLHPGPLPLSLSLPCNPCTASLPFALFYLSSFLLSFLFSFSFPSKFL